MEDLDPNLDVLPTEAVCRTCHLVFITAAGYAGLCPDCLIEAVTA